MLKKITNKIKSPKNAQQNANFQIRKHKTERKPLHYNNTKKSRNTLPKIQNKSQNSIVVYQKGKNPSQKKRKSTEIGNKAINDTSKVHKNKIQKLNSFQSRRTKIVLSKSKAKDNDIYLSLQKGFKCPSNQTNDFIMINTENEKKIFQDNIPFVLYITATWCDYCCQESNILSHVQKYGR